MAVPIVREELESALRPWLGTLFLSSNPLLDQLAERLRAYAPYKQTLESLRDEVESFLVMGINRYTHSSMMVLNDRYRTTRLTIEHIKWITDDVMGVLFDKLTPFSANFIKLNDYSLRVQSLSALRVLCQKYRSFYTDQEYFFIVAMIKRIYPPAKYEDWLTD
ncbi:MAG: hypothetical protein PHI98_02485 [Eubacteriales bacterium]|nr:hypothetical protein [Eubacteriales bacterium]